ncbi:MAG: hypothetical protein LUD72_07875 [Bacteroidales bacterium]|nr:hypothetical protein [Bacteroidales bacterium]
MRRVNRFDETSIRRIVDRVLDEAYEVSMDIDEVKRALIGKHLFIRTIDTTGCGEWSPGLGGESADGDIIDVFDVADEFEHDEPFYRISLNEPGLTNSDALDFEPNEITVLATRGRLYKYGGDWSEYGGPDETHMGWIFEIH